MSKITTKIEAGNTEIVLKRIAAILLTEFTAQKILGNDFLPDDVFYDTDYSVDEGSIPFVSVNWINSTNIDNYRTVRNDNNMFFIDIKAVGIDVCRKIINIVSVILSAEQYIILDFDTRFISNTGITDSGIDFENMNRNSQGVVSGGVNYSCWINNVNLLNTGEPLTTSEYISEINESGKKLTWKTTY